MKKIVIALVALVVTLVFGVYKTHEYQAQKAWEEKVAKAIAEQNSVDELMSSLNSKTKEALAVKIKGLSDTEFRCLVDSFIREGYTGDFEEAVIKANTLYRHAGDTYPLSTPLRWDDQDFHAFYYYSSQEFREKFNQELAVTKIIANEISGRPSKTGKEEVIEWFPRALEKKNPWTISRELYLAEELIGFGKLETSEIEGLANQFSKAVRTAGSNELGFLLRSKICQTLSEKNYSVKKREFSNNVEKIPTETLLSFLKENESYRDNFFEEVVKELKSRNLTNEQILAVNDL